MKASTERIPAQAAVRNLLVSVRLTGVFELRLRLSLGQKLLTCAQALLCGG